MNRLEQLQQLLDENNLKLTLADLLEFTYHQWWEEYLGTNLAVEHIESNTLMPIVCPDLSEKFKAAINLGGQIAKANNRW